MIETSSDIAFQNPLGTVPIAQHDMALFDGVRRRAFFPEPI